MMDTTRFRGVPDVAALHLALFTVAFCTLLLEILLTRVLSVVMWYHFTFAVISISLLGIAAGALRCYTRLSRQPHDFASVPWNLISLGLTALSLAVILPILLLTWFVATPTFSSTGLLILTAYFVACAVPFYISGYVTAAILRLGSTRISSLYAVDLVGASLGCVLSIPLLDYLGGVGSLLMVSVLSALASWVASWRSPNASRRTTALVTGLILTAMLVVHVSRSHVDVRTLKLSIREEVHRILDVKWNSYSRLALLDYFDPSARTAFPFLAWGLSDRYDGWLPRQYLITIDGASETPLTEFKEDIAAHQYLAYDITALPYHLRPGAKALIIGAGGGRDILTALWFGSRDVTGVELNRDIVHWVRDRYAPFVGHLFSRPEVRIVVDDGRNFVRSAREMYDVVQLSMIDTFAATAAGAYTLSENNLYTAEAFDEYLKHLRADGVLSINRFFLDPPHQTLRVVALAREALARRGVEHVAGHIVAIRKSSPLGDNGLVLVKLRPFTAAEIETLRRLCESLGFDPVALPGQRRENPLAEYLAASDPTQFYATYPFDIRPPTDDRPFFFNTFKISAFLSSLQLRDRIEPIRVYNFDAVFILFVLLALAGLSLCLLIFVPLLLSSAAPAGGGGLPTRCLGYFVLVGLGFILMEVVLIQRFHLYLGHPVYSLAVILFALLASSGIGSAWTARWSDTRLRRQVAVSCGTTLLLIVMHQVLWPVFLHTTLGLPRSARIVLAVVSLVPMGIAMGMPYPLGLRMISANRVAALPWVWAVNGAASVLGSILAFALAMTSGFTTVLSLAGLCYAGALMSGLYLLIPDRADRPALPRGARWAGRFSIEH